MFIASLIVVQIPGQGAFWFVEPEGFAELLEETPVPVFADECGRVYLTAGAGRIEIGTTMRSRLSE